MNWLIDIVFPGQSSGVGEGIEQTVTHSWPYPFGLTILFLIVMGACAVFLYLRERGEAKVATRVFLAVIRTALFGLVIFMMYGWMWHRHKTDLPDIVIAIDDSDSMSISDHYEDAALTSRIVAELDQLGLSEQSRLELAKAVLLRDDAKLIKLLDDRYHVRIFQIGSVVRPVSFQEENLSDQIRSIQAIGNSSRLGTNLRDIIEAQRGRPTAAIIILTDGITTEGKSLGEVAEHARRKAIPLHLIGLGNDQPPKDLRVTDLLADESIYVGDLLHLDFKVVGAGVDGKKVTVRLREKDKSIILAEKEVTLGKDGAPKQVRLAYRPVKKGDYDFVVEVEPHKGEANVENNVKVAHVDVRDETIRVLLVQEYPSYEFRYLKELLRRGIKARLPGADRAVELTTVLQEADVRSSQQDESAMRVFPVKREELFQYDVIIMGDVNPTFLSESTQENIAAFVKERGGGMVFLSGPRHMPVAFRSSSLAELFPIELETATLPDSQALLNNGFQAQPTRLGLASPQFQLTDEPTTNIAAWNKLPELFWMLEAPDLKQAARVLAEHPTRTGSGGQKLPLVCIQFVGAGKVIMHTTDESWRWSRWPGSEQLYARYWLQTIRYLSRSKLLGQSRKAEITSNRQQYRRGENARLRVRFFDERLAPAQDDGVTVVIEKEVGRRHHVRLHRDSTNRGTFEGVVSSLADGQYRAWVATPTFESSPPSLKFSIVAPPGEKARTKMDAEDLQQAARKSQGKFYTFADSHKVFDNLPRGRQVRIESLPPIPIWNSAVFAIIFLLLIVTEWLMRKRLGML
jgi:hypothetical protein